MLFPRRNASVCSWATGVLIASAIASSQPRLFIDKTTLNLGTVYQGGVVNTTIPIKNIGNTPLKIIDISTSCGCTTVKQPQKELPPAGSTKLEVAFNSTGFDGVLTKEVFIRSNDATSPSAVVTLNITVKTDLQPTDRTYNLWLGNAIIGTPVRKKISYRNISDQSIGIVAGSSASSDVSVVALATTLMPNEEGSSEIVVTATKEGYTQSEFQISLSSKNQQALIMRVTYIGVKAP